MKTILVLGLSLLGSSLSMLAATPTAETASAVSIVSRSAAGNTFAPQFSADGRFLVFVSQANNLVAGDNRQQFLDVFVRDILSGEISLISVNIAGTGGANDDSNSPVISHHGERIAFVSSANDLVANDTNSASDVFIRDRVSGTTQLVTVDSGGTGSATAPLGGVFLSSQPGLSADGRWVVFRSGATNLVALPDANGGEDIYVRNLEAGTTEVVSVNAAGTQAANGISSFPSIAPDGRWVAFVSTATDIAPNVPNQLSAVYVRDLVTNKTVCVSRDLPFDGSFRCSKPVLSGDGHALVFTVATANNSVVWLCHRQLDSDVLSIIATNTVDFGFPALSQDGQAVAFSGESTAGGPGERAIYLWRWPAGAVERISSSNTVGSVSYPAISPDGVFVSYLGEVPQGTNGSVTHLFLWDSMRQLTQLLSVTPTGKPSKWGVDMMPAAFHPGGLLLAFGSSADDLVSGDLNQASDIFWRDLTSGQTELWTPRAQNLPSLAGSAPSFLGRDALSYDGRYLLFRTFATNMAVASTNVAIENSPLTGPVAQAASVIVRDRLAQTNLLYLPSIPVLEAILNPNGRDITETHYESAVRQIFSAGQLVSARYTDGGFSSGHSQNPTVSRDGNLIAFEGSGADLVPGSTGTGIYLRDRSAGTTIAVSVRQNSSVNGNHESSKPVFSLDSRWVVFQSFATDLSSNSVSGRNLFARDLVARQTLFLGDFQGLNGTNRLDRPAISIDSHRVAFNNTSNQIVVSDLLTASNRVVCSACNDPSLNADGTRAVFESTALNGWRQILLLNLQDATTELVSVSNAGTGDGNGVSHSPLLSADGRLVVFLSDATNLVANDNNGQTDLFLRDLVTKTTFLLTPGTEGMLAGPNLFKRPVASWDGRTIVFQSFADRLNPGDYNSTSDIFVLELGGGDSDNDGLNDAWEIAYFDSLARDGNGDFDGDGVNDRAEFRAGTNPADSLGVLALTAILRRPNGGAVLYWTSIPGRTYKVQARHDLLIEGWTDLPGEVVAASKASSYIDSVTESAQQFYRVVLQP